MAMEKTQQVKHIPDRQVLELVSALPKGRATYNRLMALGWNHKVVEAKFTRMVDQGYLDYGVSLVCPFLTHEGGEALANFRANAPCYDVQQVAPS